MDLYFLSEKEEQEGGLNKNERGRTKTKLGSIIRETKFLFVQIAQWGHDAGSRLVIG